VQISIINTNPTLRCKLNTILSTKMTVFWDVAPCCLSHEDSKHSETSGNFYQTKRRNIPKDSHLHTCRRENVKSRNFMCFYTQLSKYAIGLKRPYKHYLVQNQIVKYSESDSSALLRRAVFEMITTALRGFHEYTHSKCSLTCSNIRVTDLVVSTGITNARHNSCGSTAISLISQYSSHNQHFSPQN
jgi:hypothetical protein